jgi:transglutaminase superfamily protein
MMKKILITTILIILFPLSSLLSQESDLENAWKAFLANDFDLAKELFSKDMPNDIDKAEARLGLSLTYAHYWEDEKAFEEFTKYYQLAKDAEITLKSLWITRSFLHTLQNLSDEKVDFLEELLDNENLDNDIRFMINESMTRDLLSKNELSDAQEYHDMLLNIDKWQLLGSFTNYSGSGFDKYTEALAHPEPDFKFMDNINNEVQWFDLENIQLGRWIFPSNNLRTRNSIIFAQSFCISPTARDAQIRVGVSGSVKIWVNDALAINERTHRNNGGDSYIANIKLNIGYNRILLQLGASGGESINYFVRLTDRGGNSFEDLMYVPKYKEYQKATEKFEQLDNEVISYLSKEIKNNPNKIINKLLLMHYLDFSDYNEECLELVDGMMEEYPKSAVLMTGLMSVYARLGDRTKVNSILEKLKDLGIENKNTFNLRFQDALEEDDIDKAEDIVIEMEAKYGDDETVLTKKITILHKQEKFQELFDEIEKAYKKFPLNEQFVILKYAFESQNPNSRSPIRILEDYTDDIYSPYVLRLISGYYANEGSLGSALSPLEYMADWNENNFSNIEQITDYYYSGKDYSNALEYCDILEKISPYDGAVYNLMGNIYEDQTQSANAAKKFKKAIELAPWYFKVRKHYREELLNKKPIFDYFAKDDYYTMFKLAPSAEDYPGESSVILCSDEQFVHYPNGGSESRKVILVKILTPAGIDTWKENYVPGYSNDESLLEKAEVLKKDGSKLKAEVANGHVVFTNIEPGDGILFIYKGREFGDYYLYDKIDRRSIINFFIPCLNAKYQILYPKDQTFDYVLKRSDVKPVIEEKDEFKMYSWVFDNPPQMKSESLSPRAIDIGIVIYASSIPSWDFIRDWYSDLTFNKIEVDYEVKKQLKEIFKDKDMAKMSDMEKAQLIYDYIVEDIRYSYVDFRQSGQIPQKASRVINSKIGDCKDVSTLFVVLCKAAGIESKLTLHQRSANPNELMPLPSNNFSHCIANAYIDGKEYMTELTSDNMAFNSISKSYKYSNVLVIDQDKKANIQKVGPSLSFKNSIERKSVVDISPDLEKMTVAKSSIRSGSLAAGTRSAYKDLNEDERHKRMFRAVSGDYSSIKLTHLDFGPSINSTSDTLQYHYGYDVNKPFMKLGDMYISRFPLADEMGTLDIYEQKNRDYPLDLSRYDGSDFDKETIVVNIPDAYVLMEVPENIKISNEFADYSIDFKLEGNVFTITRSLNWKIDYVEIDQIDKFLAFFTKAADSDKRQFALKKK